MSLRLYELFSTSDSNLMKTQILAVLKISFDVGKEVSYM